MKYPPVKNAHIVPRGYLKQFAEDGQVAAHLVREEREQIVSIDKAAVRRYFYRRQRPDGTEIDDFEYSFSEIESVVASVLGTVEENWPFPQPVKVRLAEFFAFQAVRGPRWKQWHQRYARNAVSKKRGDRFHCLDNGIWVPISARLLDELEASLLSETQWLVRMSSVANKLASIFASMRWDLVRFDDPVLALADHPVVEWPLSDGLRMPGPISGHGALNLLEARIPLAPDLALLLTWQDTADGGVPIAGNVAWAENLNAFSIGQADRQWISRPDADVPIGHGPFTPLSVELFPTYGPAEVENCMGRKALGERLNQRMGETSDQIEIVVARPS
ncbi:MAG: DUF4238 domain-containing protein [Solirubrobacterales bacterium]